MPAWQAFGMGTSRPDHQSAEFALYQGTYPGHSGMGYQGLARKTVNYAKTNGLKLFMVDPVMQGGTDIPGATKWIPIKPSTDAALTMGMMRWIFENEKYNKAFLECPTIEAAETIGYRSVTNATNLVIMDEKHKNYRKLLRAEDIGLEGEALIVIDKETGEPKIDTEVSSAELFYEGDVKGIKVTTSLNILKNNTNRFTLEDYSKICEVPVEQIIEIAKEFTSHGHRVGVDSVGGTVSINAFPFAVGLFILPALMGAYNMKGGMVAGGAGYKSHADGPKYVLSTIEGATEPKGPRISREAFRYEDTTEYKNKVAKGQNPYPSKMPWHPNGFNLDGHAIFSAANKYPYQCKILVNCNANPIYGGPSSYNDTIIPELKKTSNIPLFIGIDTVVGETSAFADYLIPDSNSYEHWAVLGARANHTTRITGVRWPVVEPPTEIVGEYNQHINMETYMIEVAKRIGMPGYGDDAVVDMEGNKWPINTRADYWMKAIANTAYDIDEVDDITELDKKLTGLNEIPEEWTKAVKPEELNKVLNVMAKGGKFEPDNANSTYDGDEMIYKSKGIINIYSEKNATSRNSFTGEYNEGAPTWMPETFANGELMDDLYPVEEYPFRICSAKPKLRGLSMMSNSPTLQNIGRTNFVEINSIDANAFGLKDGQEVYVESAMNKAKGIVKVREGISKGTVGIHFGYGKWEYGSKDSIVDGKTLAGDSVRGEGTATNQLGLLDHTIEGLYGVSEMTTGSPQRNGIRVKVTPV